MRSFAAIPLILLLGGCVAAIPPAVTIASYAVDGVSVLVSGKSVSDHAISEIADQDCVMFRLLEFERPCRDYKEDVDETPSVEVANGASVDAGRDAVPSAQPAWAVHRAVWSDLDGEPAVASAATQRNPAAAPVIVAEDLPPPAASTPQQVASASLRPVGLISETPGFVRTVPAHVVSAPAAPGGDVRYVVFGSFADADNARCLAQANADLGATVVPAKVRGNTRYRVVSGARPLAEARSLRSRLVAAGVSGAWLLGRCGAGRVDHCVAADPMPGAQIASAHIGCAPMQALIESSPVQEAETIPPQRLVGG